MTLHIDLYSTTGGPISTCEWKPEALRQFEGQQAVDYAAWKPLPHFNGYTLQSGLHEDGECEEHRPKGLVWEPVAPGGIEFT